MDEQERGQIDSVKDEILELLRQQAEQTRLALEAGPPPASTGPPSRSASDAGVWDAEGGAGGGGAMAAAVRRELARAMAPVLADGAAMRSELGRVADGMAALAAEAERRGRAAEAEARRAVVRADALETELGLVTRARDQVCASEGRLGSCGQ